MKISGRGSCVLMVAAVLAAGSTSFGQQAPVVISGNWKLQDVAKAADTGDKVSAKEYAGAASWYSATVPGTVLTTLVNNKVYPEPLYGENNRPDKIPESLCRTSYWYRTTVMVPGEFAGNGRHTWLNFDGINYTAEVWVNGKQAGTIRGAFARGILDVTELVKPGEEAVIAVKINPPPHPGNPLEQTVANGTGGNGGALMQDGPTFGCTVGWDWIPGIRDRDMGIWQKVTLSSTGPVRVDDPSVSSKLPLPKTDAADLTLITTVWNATDQPQTGTLRGTFEGETFSVPVTLRAHEKKEVTVTPKEAAALHMSNPKLWWPNTYGAPNLYKMQVAFDVGGAKSDERAVNFGVREITYHVTPEMTLIPQTENLTVIVNGVPVMCKGGCWGMDEAMKRIPKETLDAKVKFHQLANATMIRNWVGQSTGEDFYDACDRYGILIWDEMFQANQSDGPQVGGIPSTNDTPEVKAWRADVTAMYLDNVREKVVRFRSHPSIALWCGRNESYPAPKEIADGLTKLTAELDPARFYQANSGDGRGVRSGGPYSWRVPQAYFGGGRGGLEPFKTELGSVSIPTLEAIKAMMPEKDWYDLNDDWAEHDLLAGAQAGNTFPVNMSARYGAIAQKDLVDFTRKSQMAMYETYRAMYEGRMAKLFNPCAAVLTWMSNPSQPSFVWQYYSYDLEPLAALYGAKKGMEPLHVQWNVSDSHLMVINTGPAAKETLAARVRVFNMDGTQAADRTVAVSAKPCAATDLGAMEWPAALSPVHFIKLELMDGGKLVSENFYWRTTATLATTPAANTVFGAGGAAGRGRGGGGGGGGGGRGNAPAGPAEDFSALNAMPTAELTAVTKRRDGGGVDVTLTNATKVVALQAHVQLRNGRTHERVLPVFYSDNYVSLLPGESRTIAIDTPVKLEEAPEVTVDGWNVSVGGTSGEVKVGVNKDAFVGPKGAN